MGVQPAHFDFMYFCAILFEGIEERLLWKPFSSNSSAFGRIAAFYTNAGKERKRKDGET